MNYRNMIPGDMGYFLDGFTKQDYPRRFADYCTKAVPEIQKASAADAEELVRWMDTLATGLFRKRKRLEQEMLLMQYTVPAALRAERPDFAEALHSAWNGAHPELAFGMANYEEFYKNFNTTLLGFKIEKGD